MLASEAIKDLTELITKVGDCDLWITDADTERLLPVTAINFKQLGYGVQSEQVIHIETDSYSYRNPKRKRT